MEYIYKKCVLIRIPVLWVNWISHRRKSKNKQRYNKKKETFSLSNMSRKQTCLYYAIVRKRLGKLNPELGTVFVRLHRNFSFMACHDLPAEAEADTGTVGFGRVERDEYLVHCFR